jgi:hypothetical protein
VEQQIKQSDQITEDRLMLAACLLWLRNHFELNEPHSPSLRTLIVADVDRVLEECALDLTTKEIERFSSRYQASASSASPSASPVEPR